MSVPGFFATEDFCPQCKRRVLIVYRIVQPIENGPVSVRHLRTIPFRAQNSDTLRATLAQIEGVTADDVEFMLAVAVELADHA